MKIIEVIEKIKEFHQPYSWKENTRDKILCGDINNECTGICVTCCATFELLEKCARQRINLIISHEGITFNYEKMGDVNLCSNEVVQRKLQFAKEHNIVVYRDHDAMHGPGGPNDLVREKTDLIFYGTMKELQWQQYMLGDEMKPLWYKVPTMTARQFAKVLIDKWNLNGLRIVGNLDSQISTVFFCEHVNGSERDVKIIDKCLQADAIIPLEICDYTLTTYVRDASAMGLNKVLFEMGHFNAEELGMKYLARLLSDYLKEQLPVVYIQSGDGFKYLSKEEKI